MKRLMTGVLCAGMLMWNCEAKEYQLASPDGQLKAVVNAGDKLTYEVTLDGKEIIAPWA